MLAASPIIRRAVYGISAGLFGTGMWWSRSGPHEDEAALRKRELAVKVPHRSQILSSLKSDKVFDVLVVGGGATGTGVALVRSSKVRKGPLSICTFTSQSAPPQAAPHVLPITL